ncbi:MAG: hypothetical protein ABS934_03325 [Psychrobacillus sp.]
MKSTLFLFSIVIALLFSFAGCSEKSTRESNEDKKDTLVNWGVRDDYVQDEKVLMTVVPDPNLKAGKSFGYLFSFTAPFETFEKKKLAIYAYHKETEEKITVLPPKTIEEPSPGYSTLSRFPVVAKVPKSGIWRYEVILDDKFYADIVLELKE